MIFNKNEILGGANFDKMINLGILKVKGFYFQIRRSGVDLILTQSSKGVFVLYQKKNRN